MAEQYRTAVLNGVPLKVAVGDNSDGDKVLKLDLITADLQNRLYRFAEVVVFNNQMLDIENNTVVSQNYSTFTLNGVTTRITVYTNTDDLKVVKGEVVNPDLSRVVYCEFEISPSWLEAAS